MKRINNQLVNTCYLFFFKSVFTEYNQKEKQTFENKCTNSIIKEKGTPGGMERGRQEKLGISDRIRESREKIII